MRHFTFKTSYERIIETLKDNAVINVKIKVLSCVVKNWRFLYEHNWLLFCYNDYWKEGIILENITNINDLSMFNKTYKKGLIKVNISKIAKELIKDRKTIRKD